MGRHAAGRRLLHPCPVIPPAHSLETLRNEHSGISLLLVTHTTMPTEKWGSRYSLAGGSVSSRYGGRQVRVSRCLRKGNATELPGRMLKLIP